MEILCQSFSLNPRPLFGFCALCGPMAYGGSEQRCSDGWMTITPRRRESSSTLSHFVISRPNLTLRLRFD